MTILHYVVSHPAAHLIYNRWHGVGKDVANVRINFEKEEGNAREMYILGQICGKDVLVRLSDCTGWQETFFRLEESFPYRKLIIAPKNNARIRIINGWGLAVSGG